MDSSLPRPLGKNRGGYLGEPLDLPLFLRELDEVSARHGWRSEIFFDAGSIRLSALRRTIGTPTRRIYISAGIHGDEPAGPLAVLELLKDDHWGDAVDLWICPCLNPTGLAQSTRENATGHDLNRQYRDPEAAETRAHIAWLSRQPRFDVALCLHEDWESRGFYLYELNPDQRPSHAERMINAVRGICPIDLSETIEGRPAAGGVIRPSVDPLSRPEWPEAFFLLNNHNTRHSYTLEAASDFYMPIRVASLVAALRTVL